MAGIPFFVKVASANRGGGTYTVPAGKFAVLNAFVNPTGTFTAIQIGATGTQPILSLNNIPSLFISSTNRLGPLVFNAGDVLSCPGGIFNPPNEPGDFTSDGVLGLIGFLYDTSPRKVPLNQILVGGSSSYTVPSGKYFIANIYSAPATTSEPFSPGGIIANVQLNGVMYGQVMTTPSPIPLGGFTGQFGPWTLGAGQTISFVPAQGPGAPMRVLLNGFLYNNT